MIMCDIVAGVVKYEKFISNSQVLERRLNDKGFLKMQIENVFTVYGGKVSPMMLIRELSHRLEDNEEVMHVVESNFQNTDERTSILHWYAFCIYAAAKEWGLVPTLTPRKVRTARR